MQTPEKLSLIGGSILLASTLVFTLKSQASNILPKVDQGMTSLFKSDKDSQTAAQRKQQQAQEKQTFDSNYQRAQQNHWQTGTWGNAKYYIDDGNNFHVGSGQLQGALEDTLGYDKLQQIQTVNLDGPAQAPQDSQNLFGLENGNDVNTTTTQINGLAKLDTSHVTNMYEMFDEDSALSNLSVSNFNTSHVTNMAGLFMDDDALSNLDLSHFDTSDATNMNGMFLNDHDLSKLDVSHFDTHNVTSMNSMFAGDNALSNLDVSHFDTSDDTSTSHMFEGDNSLAKLDLSGWNTSKVISGSNYTGYMFNNTLLNQLTLGNNTKLSDNQGWYGNYKNGSQILNTNQLSDKNVHPGTWVKQ